MSDMERRLDSMDNINHAKWPVTCSDQKKAVRILTIYATFPAQALPVWTLPTKLERPILCKMNIDICTCRSTNVPHRHGSKLLEQSAMLQMPHVPIPVRAAHAYTARTAAQSYALYRHPATEMRGLFGAALGIVHIRMAASPVCGIHACVDAHPAKSLQGGREPIQTFVQSLSPGKHLPV